MDFMELLRETQNEVAGLCDNQYYKTAYQKDEFRYWDKVAQWLWELAERKVLHCLDIGCAYGTLALYVKKLFKCEIYCTDYVDLYMSNRMVTTYNFHYQVSNIELDPFPFKKMHGFDLILFTEVLEHLNFHPEPTLARIHDLLTDEGVLLLSTPDAEVYGRVDRYQQFDEIPYPKKGLPVIDDHIYVYHENELRELFKRVGLQIICFEKNSYGHFNAMLKK